MKYRGNTSRLCITLVATILALVGPAFGQTTEEHATHHPAPGEASPAPINPAVPAAGMPMSGGGNQAAPDTLSTTPITPGGMGAGMEEMMKRMGTPPRKEIYPSLMALPDEATGEARTGIEQLAHERMEAGTTLLSSGLEKLSDSTSDEDYAAMQQATAQMREGLAELEAGIAARRVLAEGKAPRNLALDWFKREMNLASPVRPEEPLAFLGIKPFHLFTIVLLVAFALAMVAMYFFKMRRATALFRRIEPGSGASPPGASPPLAGASGPSAPVMPPPGGASVPVPGGDAANAAG